jgi:hypothetical protein
LTEIGYDKKVRSAQYAFDYAITINEESFLPEQNQIESIDKMLSNKYSNMALGVILSNMFDYEIKNMVTYANQIY